MSKLDEIVSYNENVPSERIKEEIKALFLELIGEDEVFIDIPVVNHLGEVTDTIKGETYTPYMIAKNQLRAELRTKVDSL